MARKSMGLPTGVEFAGQSIRIRFTWNGERRCETLPYPQTPKGIKAASDLRSNVVSLAKHGVLDANRYAELFPNSKHSSTGTRILFGEYAQAWLNGREVVAGTKRNYRISLNRYWMPRLALMPLDILSPMDLRKVVAETPWKTPTVKRAAIQRLGAMLNSAVIDGILQRNPVDSLELPSKQSKGPDPFTVQEADTIIESLYNSLTGSLSVYAAYFEFAFYTGMRPGEIAALRWDEVDMDKRLAHVCRIVVDGVIEERTKTKAGRTVMLNSRALNALQMAKRVADLRRTQKRIHQNSPYVFPPTRTSEYLAQASLTDKFFKPTLKSLGIRGRRQYNCRHTYATMCLMAGINPAFIANQLGHSVQMLLSTYAKWLNSSNDWSEIDKLETILIGTKSVQTQPVPL
ncbi:tyrosine-type recombinase/integrase [Pseudomonas viridiflava]|uniref:tyrosine-type recombinase/integrase n=1 Tax=Pseudomonas viridiflava TaxID=33069 RepID=UPI000F044814|nr:tyrosine-type recombinase/integrase [Pseudomonas viridiflava]